MARLSEKQEDVKDQSLVHHEEDVSRHSKDVRICEATIHRVEEKSKQKMPRVFPTTKIPLPQRRTVGWSISISIFSSSLAHFPRPINTIIVLMI